MKTYIFADRTAHTPGPWIAQIGDKGGTIWGPGNNPADRPIAYIRKRYDQPLLDETDLANGLLLAAAPELLAALTGVYNALRLVSEEAAAPAIEGGYLTPLMLARIAIAKATGGTP